MQQKLNIALLGYGKMGQSIERLGTAQGHTFSLKINELNLEELTANAIQGCDVAIEFSTPATAAHNLRFCIEHDVPVICGTTGWLKHKKEIEHLCLSKKGSFLYASNFSLGVNLFFEFTSYISRIISKYEDYTTSIEEIHHTAKKDKPSGTAITLAERIVETSTYEGWQLVEQQENNNDESKSLTIDSIRQKDVVGIHNVQFKSVVDDIIIAHRAHSRDGFALGALLAAHYIHNKQGIFTMKDVLHL